MAQTRGESMRAVVWLAVGMMAVALGGCCRKYSKASERSESATTASSKSKATAGPSKPPTARTNDKGEISFAEIEGHLKPPYIIGLNYSVSFEKFPGGTRVKIGDDDKTVLSDKLGSVSFRIDVGEAIGALAPSDAVDYKFKLDPKMQAHITFPNGVETDVALAPASVSVDMHSMFDKAKNSQPVLFGKESEAAPAQHSILTSVSITPEVIGPAKVMKEVDWLAYKADSSPRQGKMCAGYKASNETTPRSLPLEMVDQELVIVERKTGKEIDRKLFKAPARCPMFATGDHAHAYPDSNAMKQWLRSKRAGK